MVCLPRDSIALRNLDERAGAFNFNRDGLDCREQQRHFLVDFWNFQFPNFQAWRNAVQDAGFHDVHLTSMQPK